MSDEEPVTLTGSPSAGDSPPDGAVGGFECDVCGERFWHGGQHDAFVARVKTLKHILAHDGVPGTPGAAEAADDRITGFDTDRGPTHD